MMSFTNIFQLAKNSEEEVFIKEYIYVVISSQIFFIFVKGNLYFHSIFSGDDESTQAFVPFIMDVRLGSGDVTSSSVDLEEPLSTPTAIILPGSPPAASTPTTGLSIDKTRDNTTPPSSPNINTSHLAK